VHPAGFGIGGSAVTAGWGGVGRGATAAVVLGAVGAVFAVDATLADATGSRADAVALGAAEGGTSTTLGASGAGSLHPA
jgi:hypothetical protein